MVKRTGSTNPYLTDLINNLKKEKKPLWQRLAKELSASTRNRREVNLTRISKALRKGEIAVVPGKVLGVGNAPENGVIAAWKFSASAEDKIKKAKGKALSIDDLLKDKPKKVRIVG